MKDTVAVLVMGGDWGLGRFVERAGLRWQTCWDAGARGWAVDQ